MSSDLKFTRELIELRRNKVLELVATGLQQNEIAAQLGVSTATISLDMQFHKETARSRLQEHIERIPEQYQICKVGFNLVLRKAWELYNNAESMLDKRQSLMLISDTYDKLKNLSTEEKTLEEAVEWITKKKEQLSSNLTHEEPLGSTEPKGLDEEEEEEQNAE
jgi:predicted transcriptional regulator